MLTGWIAAVIGIIIVVFSLNSLIREIRKGGIPDMEDQSFSDTFYSLLQRSDQFGENLDDINQTFYETVERLEKRIEVLERKAPAATEYSRVLPQKKESVTESRKTEPEPRSPESNFMSAQIRRLLSEGKDSQQVARELNLGVGEVELIRRLKTNQQNTSTAPMKSDKSSL